jgi:hypothetical protein
MSRFKITVGSNDPRGKHSAVWDSECGNIVVARAWEEEDARELMRMLNAGEIQPNYESRYINHDVYLHLHKPSPVTLRMRDNDKRPNDRPANPGAEEHRQIRRTPAS